MSYSPARPASHWVDWPTTTYGTVGSAEFSKWDAAIYDLKGALFHPTDPAYGAVGDNSTDDQAAFALLTSALTSGAVVDLGGRTYYLTTAFTVSTANVTIRNGALRASTNNVAIITASGVTFQNVRLSRSASPASSGDSIAQRSCLNVRAANFRSLYCDYTDANMACVYIAHALGNGTAIVGGTMTNSSARQNACGIYVADGATGNTDILVSGVTMTGTGCPDGILFFDSSRCTVHNCDVSALTRLATLTMTGWSLVSGNVYKTTDRTDGSTRILKNNGVQLGETTSTPTTPAASTFGVSGGFLYVNLSGTDPSTRTMTSDITSGYGIMFYGTSTGTGALCDNLVSGNKVHDVDGFGIYMQLAYAASLNNTTSCNSLANVCREGSQNSSLPFAGVGWTGGSNCKMIGDSIQTVGVVGKVAPGVYTIPGGLSTTCTGVATGVSVRAATSDGFRIASEDWSYVGCWSEGNTTNGFNCVATATADTFRFIKLIGCTSASNTGRGATFDKSSFGGAKVQVDIIGGTYRNNTQDGIMLYDATDSKIVGVTSYKNGAGSFAQIYIRNAAARILIDDCEVNADAAWPGIKVESGCTDVALGINHFGTALTSPLTVSPTVRTGGTIGAGARYYGAGSPESVLTAAIGATYTRSDGGASTTMYVKESGTGNTGWIAK